MDLARFVTVAGTVALRKRGLLGLDGGLLYGAGLATPLIFSVWSIPQNGAALSGDSQDFRRDRIEDAAKLSRIGRVVIFSNRLCGRVNRASRIVG